MKSKLALAANGFMTLALLIGVGTRVGPRAVAADDGAAKVRAVKLEGLTLQVPVGWVQQPPASNLRLGQFSIPATGGDKEAAELGIFNFGFGGGVKENVERWINQFEGADRKAKTTAGKCPQGEYVFVEISGTYKKPIGPPIQQRTQSAPEYRMLGVILAVEKQGHYFLKLTGPDKTVAAAADSFRASLGADAKAEKPYGESAVE